MHINSLATEYPELVRRITDYAPFQYSPQGDIREWAPGHVSIESTSYVLPLATGRRPSVPVARYLAHAILAGQDVHYPSNLPAQFVNDPRLEGYGPALAPSLVRAVSYLRKDPLSRRAAATMGHRGGDSTYPCTLSLSWLIRNDRLVAFVSMRSSDVWLGFPNDMYAFASIQHSMARLLGILPGAMHISANSLHLYERDVPKVERLILPNAKPPLAAAPITYGISGGEWVDVQAAAAHNIEYPWPLDGGGPWQPRDAERKEQTR